MPPYNDRHDLGARRDRIDAANATASELEKLREFQAKTRRAETTLQGEHDPEIVSKLAVGVEFISACEIRVVPKVQPGSRAQMKSALMQSRLFIAGVKFRIEGIAMVKRSGKDAQGNDLPGKQWYRVSVVSPRGKILHRGFVLEPAIRGKIVEHDAA